MALRGAILLALAATLAGCVPAPRFTSSPAPRGPSTPGIEEGGFEEEGTASYYAEEFNGRTTSNGERYDMNAMTAAHQTLPFNTRVRVTNKATGQSVVVRINDRGPFKGGRIIDLSLAAAKAISLIGTGTAVVRLEIVNGTGQSTVKEQ